MSLAGKAHQVMLQGVHELYELNETPQLWEANSHINRLVFIGTQTLVQIVYLHAMLKIFYVFHEQIWRFNFFLKSFREFSQAANIK